MWHENFVTKYMEELSIYCTLDLLDSHGHVCNTVVLKYISCTGMSLFDVLIEAVTQLKKIQGLSDG